MVSGNLRVFTLSPDGNEATLYLINPGETCVLALNCIFNDLLYPAWVEAGPATQVAVIPGAIYRTLFESESAIRDMTVQAFPNGGVGQTTPSSGPQHWVDTGEIGQSEEHGQLTVVLLHPPGSASL